MAATKTRPVSLVGNTAVRILEVKHGSSATFRSCPWWRLVAQQANSKIEYLQLNIVLIQLNCY